MPHLCPFPILEAELWDEMRSAVNEADQFISTTGKHTARVYTQMHAKDKGYSGLGHNLKKCKSEVKLKTLISSQMQMSIRGTKRRWDLPPHPTRSTCAANDRSSLTALSRHPAPIRYHSLTAAPAGSDPAPTPPPCSFLCIHPSIHSPRPVSRTEPPHSPVPPRPPPGSGKAERDRPLPGQVRRVPGPEDALRVQPPHGPAAERHRAGEGRRGPSPGHPCPEMAGAPRGAGTAARPGSKVSAAPPAARPRGREPGAAPAR